MPLSERYKESRVVYYSSCSLMVLGAVVTLGVPLSWLTGRIRMDHLKPWLVWAAGIVVFVFFLSSAIKYLRLSEEERMRSGD